jgi:CRISPR-associated protein Cmr2
MDKYTGLSIGPIFATLMKAKKTREIWLSSYIFSFIMKEIIKKLKENISVDDFVTPYVENNDEFFKNDSVGKFHDRLIYKGEKKYLQKAIDEVLEELAEIISKDLKENKDKIFNYLKEYFKFYIVEIESDEPIKEVYEFLNSQEMFRKISNSKRDYLFEWIKLRKKENSFYNDIDKFKSLPEIAMLEKVEESDDEQKDYQRAIKRLNDRGELKPYHKYVAIVNADGDNLSDSLKRLSVKEVSKKLFDFSNKAVEVIRNYGGDVIYAGGDDLLFFAPVKTKEKDIFKLLKEISDEYKIPNSTISFGVSITFYKFPLYEALNISRDLLYEAKENGKNAIAFKVIKHSGQMFESIVKKDEKFDDFINFINFEEDEAFLHSLYSKISYYKKVLEEIKDNKEMLNNFFEHYFNENYKRYESFLKRVADMIFEYKDIDFVYSALRYMKFLKGEK